MTHHVATLRKAGFHSIRLILPCTSLPPQTSDPLTQAAPLKHLDELIDTALAQDMRVVLELLSRHHQT